MEEKSKTPPPAPPNVKEVIARSYADIEKKIVEFEQQVWNICKILVPLAMGINLLLWWNPGIFIPIGAGMGLLSLHILVTTLKPVQERRLRVRTRVFPASGGKVVLLLISLFGLAKLGASLWQMSIGLFLSQMAITIASIHALRPTSPVEPPTTPDQPGAEE